MPQARVKRFRTRCRDEWPSVMGIVRRLRRPVDAFRWLEDTALDVKHTVRMFVHTPSFTVAAIAALALGIAVNTAMFSVINAVLLRPFSYHQSDRIVMFQNTFGQGIRTGSAAPVEFNWWRQQTDAFENVSAYAFNVANLGGESLIELIRRRWASTTVFGALDESPSMVNVRPRTARRPDRSDGRTSTRIAAWKPRLLRLAQGEWR